MEAGIQEVRTILRFVGAALVGCLLCMGLVAVLVPFEVELKAAYSDSVGDIYMTRAVASEQEVASSHRSRLSPGESLRLEPTSSVRIELVEDMKAFVYLYGPADWKLVESVRRGTVIDHLQRDSDKLRVVILQQQGTAVYDFRKSELALKNIRLRFPDGEFTPATPCFQATALAGEIPSAIVEVPCGGQVIPMSEPALPVLPSGG